MVPDDRLIEPVTGYSDSFRYVSAAPKDEIIARAEHGEIRYRASTGAGRQLLPGVGVARSAGSIALDSGKRCAPFGG